MNKFNQSITLIGFLIMLPSQIIAESKFYCGSPRLACSVFLPEVPPDCISKSPDTLVNVEYPQEIDGQICPTNCNNMNKIYDNCFIDKMKGLSKVGALSVIRSCERIACDPSVLQKLKYK